MDGKIEGFLQLFEWHAGFTAENILSCGLITAVNLTLLIGTTRQDVPQNNGSNVT
jgi:hypothetical protein